MMVTSKKLNVVLDIGKTNVKLNFVNNNNKTVKSFTTKQKNINKFGIKTLNSNLIVKWSLDKIQKIEKTNQLAKFVCTAHGTSIALIDHDNKEILACTDYEFKFDQFFDEYKKIAPKFSESFTPFLEGGLNIGTQLYYIYKKNPNLLLDTKYILNYPQYIVWKLTNNFVSEISYLGCHTHLWNYKKNKLSSLVNKLGIKKKFPQIKKAWEIVGQKKIGKSNIQIINGVHDSNASYLYFKNSGIKDFTLISTGTWYILFNQKTSLSNLNPSMDMLANIDVFGESTPTMRFMGGREYDYLVKTFKISNNTKPLSRFNYKDFLIYPSYAAGGAFIKKRINTGLFKKLKKGEVYYLICLYMAFLINFCLNKMNSTNTIILDGPITKNDCIMKILSTLRDKQIVLKNKKEIGTSLGATNLFDIKKKNKLDTKAINKFQNKNFKNVYNIWEENLYKKKLLNSS